MLPKRAALYKEHMEFHGTQMKDWPRKDSLNLNFKTRNGGLIGMSGNIVATNRPLEEF